MTMDSLPPNDPNRNPSVGNSKSVPHDGSSRNNRRRGVNADGQMDVFGDLSDGQVAMMMFVVGVVSWFLREQCVC